MNELLSLDFTLDPTFNIYDANRDLQRARRAEWHELYTLPIRIAVAVLPPVLIMDSFTNYMVSVTYGS